MKDEFELAMGTPEAETRHCGDANEPRPFPTSARSLYTRWEESSRSKAWGHSRMNRDPGREESHAHTAARESFPAGTRMPLTQERSVEWPQKDLYRWGHRRINELSRETGAEDELETNGDDRDREMSNVQMSPHLPWNSPSQTEL